MEQRVLGNWHGLDISAAYPPVTETQNLSSPSRPLRRRSFLPDTGFGAPLPDGFPADQTLEPLFSKLSLFPNFHQQAPAPLPPFPEMAAESVPVLEGDPSMGFLYPSNSGNQGLNNVGLQGGLTGFQHNYGGQNLGFAGDQRSLLVGGPTGGPAPGFSGGFFREPCYRDLSAFGNIGLNNDDSSQRLTHQCCSNLLCKLSLSRINDHQLPSLPSNQNSVSRQSLDDAHVNGLAWNNSSLFRPNLQNNRQLYARNRNPFDGISLQDMRGRIVSICKDQSGSKILQAKLDGANPEEIEMVLCEVIEDFADLMKSQSGSYFVQKLFGVCSEEQRTKIVVAITTNSFELVDICLNFNGSRTMQKLLEDLSTPEQISFVIAALCPGGVALANDPNGQHVIRYCLINYSHEYHKHLLNEIANNFCRIATDKSGCCVLQACVEYAHREAKERLIKETIKNSLLLAEDPYGNYVVQHLLGLKIPQVTALLVVKLKGHFVALSSDKYGSNVVEKLLVEAKEHSTTIIMEILASPNVDSLLLHPYGNFVIQKALSIARIQGGEIYHALCRLIEVNAPSMRSNLFGKKILGWFEKRRHNHVV